MERASGVFTDKQLEFYRANIIDALLCALAWSPVCSLAASVVGVLEDGICFCGCVYGVYLCLIVCVGQIVCAHVLLYQE